MEILGDGASNAFVAVGMHLASGLVVGESLGIHARVCPLLAVSRQPEPMRLHSLS